MNLQLKSAMLQSASISALLYSTLVSTSLSNIEDYNTAKTKAFQAKLHLPEWAVFSAKNAMLSKWSAPSSKSIALPKTVK